MSLDSEQPMSGRIDGRLGSLVLESQPSHSTTATITLPTP